MIKRTNQSPQEARRTSFLVRVVLSIMVFTFFLQGVAGELTTGLVAYWSFDETSGIIIVDQALGINNGTINSISQLGQSGVVNTALKINGTNLNMMTVLNHQSFNFTDTNFSIGFWINASSKDTTNTDPMRKSEGTIGLLSYQYNETTRKGHELQMDTTDGTNNIINLTGNMDPGNFQYLTFTYNGTFNLFLDGVLRHSQLYVGKVGSNSANFTFQCISNPCTTGVVLDEMGLWNRSLSIDEVSELYNSGAGLNPLKGITITRNSPDDAITFSTITELLFNTTLTPTKVDLTNITLSIRYTNNTIFNQTFRPITGTTEQQSLITVSDIPIGNFVWGIEACGDILTGGSLCVLTNNRTFNRSVFSTKQEGFPKNVFETDSIEFLLNITTIPSTLSVSSNLVYNGTSFVGDTSCNASGFCQLSRTIDIPLVTAQSQNKTFFWNITVFDGTSALSSISTTRSHNVTQVHFQTCDLTFTVPVLNFTAFNEEDNSRINPFYIAGEFDFWLGSGEIKREIAFANASTDELAMCISPAHRTFFIDDTVEYNEVINSTDWNTRNYYFQQESVTNVTQHIPLFLLDADDSTSFILKVQDTNLLPVPNVLITIQRFNVGTGNLTTVQIARTDDNGQTVGFFKTETVDYKFIITKDGVILLETGQQKILPETAPFTLIFTVGEDEGAPWARFEDLDDLTKSLKFNSSSSNITFTYIDSSGSFTSSRLIVVRQNLTGISPTICDVSSTSSSAILICATGGISGSYVASSFITRGSDTFLVEQITFKVETFSDVAGLLGVFLAFFIILVSAFAFKFNEIAGIVLVNLSVIMVNIIGLVNFGGLFVFGLMGVSIIIIVLLKK